MAFGTNAASSAVFLAQLCYVISEYPRCLPQTTTSFAMYAFYFGSSQTVMRNWGFKHLSQRFGSIK